MKNITDSIANKTMINTKHDLVLWTTGCISQEVCRQVSFYSRTLPRDFSYTFKNTNVYHK